MEIWKRGQASLQNSFLNISQNQKQLFWGIWIKRKKHQVNKKWAFVIRSGNIFFSPREDTTNYLFAAIGLADPKTVKVYKDITGRFPFIINWEMQYMLISYPYDSNAIFVEPIKSRSDMDILRSCGTLYEKL